jgi:hypothetical protein
LSIIYKVDPIQTGGVWSFKVASRHTNICVIKIWLNNIKENVTVTDYLCNPTCTTWKHLNSLRLRYADWGAKAGYVLVFFFPPLCFFCGRFNYAVNSREYTIEQLSHFWIMSWEGCGRYWLWPNLRKYLRNCLQGMTKLNTAALWAEISTQDVLIQGIS